eukprot:2606378-Pleurochrysis_carterae.AAC.1
MHRHAHLCKPSTCGQRRSTAPGARYHHASGHLDRQCRSDRIRRTRTPGTLPTRSRSISSPQPKSRGTPLRAQHLSASGLNLQHRLCPSRFHLSG